MKRLKNYTLAIITELAFITLVCQEIFDLGFNAVSVICAVWLGLFIWVNCVKEIFQSKGAKSDRTGDRTDTAA